MEIVTITNWAEYVINPPLQEKTDITKLKKDLLQHGFLDNDSNLVIRLEDKETVYNDGTKIMEKRNVNVFWDRYYICFDDSMLELLEIPEPATTSNIPKQEIINKIELYIKNHKFELVREFFNGQKMLYLDSKQASLFDSYLKKLGFMQGVQDQQVHYKLDKEYINRYYNCSFGKIIFEFNNF